MHNMQSNSSSESVSQSQIALDLNAEHEDAEDVGSAVSDENAESDPRDCDENSLAEPEDAEDVASAVSDENAESDPIEGSEDGDENSLASVN
jgi:hypothetical protein